MGMQRVQYNLYIQQVARMKHWITFLALLLVVTSHIYSSPPRVTYNYDGKPKYHSLFMSLQTGMGASDYLKIVWWENLHVTLETQVVVNLISFSNNLQVASAVCTVESPANFIYYVTFGYAMQPNTWYEVQIFPNVNPVTAPSSNLIQILAVSDIAATAIIYDSNMAFGFIDILAPLTSPAPGSLSILCNSSSTQSTVPAAIYSLDIYVTPTVTSANGGNFTLYIYYDSSLGIHGTGTSNTDFTFMGLCQSAATPSLSAAVLLYCSISSDLSTITFAIGQTVTAGQTIRITTSISNPSYNSVRGIKGYWTEFISGKVLQNGLQSNALTVNKITINTVTPRILLFWGIQSTLVDSNLTTALPLFKAGGSNIFPYNSFNIGFSFTASSPISGQYIVKMTIGATGVIEGSIAHNLPNYNGVPVYCYYDTSNLWITCQNVGAFINTGYRYFISGKAYFDSGKSSPITSFGAVSITPIVYSNTGAQILSPQLYTSLAGVSTTLATSQQFLDTSGYHNTASYSIGNAQIVSYYDDQSLSSTANAIQGLLTGTNSTVGVVPDLGTSQQLLLLLKTNPSAVSIGGNPATDFTIQLLFNSAVISFQSAGSGRGLDFVGYQNSTGVWSIEGSPCYYNSLVVCEKYNNDTPYYNIKSLVNTGGSTNFYGLYTFKCGSTYKPTPGCSSNCNSECTMFTGIGNSDKGSGVMAMRQVVLPDGYHSPIYADKNLLDFLLIFWHGSSIAAYCLINGYTITGARMQNIKAAYVNYYDTTSGPYNKGVRIPMMVRIGGGVLPSQSKNATAIGIFFDDYIDATTFYTTTGNSWAVGCSTGNCAYTPNKGMNNVRTNNWLGNRLVMVYDLPPIQNEFNILVPVTPDITNRNPPKVLTIAFFTQNYSVGDTSGLLQTQSVFRLFGPVVTGSVGTGITTIAGLSRTGGSTFDMQLANNYVISGQTFGVSLNTTNMYSNPTNNTFTYSNTDTSVTYGQYFGAGYTITSFYYNIFASSTLKWSQPPANTATTCTVFGYVYNELETLGSNPFKNGQWMYTTFCPIDSSFTPHSAAANIDFLNPQYPTVFTNGFPLLGVITIAYSDQNGFLRATRRQSNSIATLVRTCTTAKLQTYNPTSSGKQRATFTLTTPSILMSASGFTGYSSFRVNFAIPSSTVTSASVSMSSTQCDVAPTTLSCTVYSASPTSVTVTLAYTGTGTMTVTYMEINLYATVGASFGVAAAYTATVTLPQYYSTSVHVPFGNWYNSVATYCTCTSSYTVGITPYQTSMNLNSLTFSSNMIDARGKISFNFGAASYRESFFSSSTFVFNLAFLSRPNYNTWYLRSNFRCLIYEGANATSMSLSSSWKTLSLSSASFTSVILAPKAEISNPSAILYSMVCYGGGTPDGNSSGSITLSWQDGGSAVQTATSIAYLGTAYISIPSSTTTGTLSKRFPTSGLKAFYSFTVSINSQLTSSSRFYFDFHMQLSSRLDTQGTVECYIRTGAAESTAQYTYCTFTNPWQLMVWNLNNITSGTSFFIDIFNIDQPKAGDIGGSQQIGLTYDLDSNYTNGFQGYRDISDTAPTGTPSDIFILAASASNSYILSTQDITIDFDTVATGLFPTKYLYVIYPAAYAQWIIRTQTLQTAYPGTTTNISCELNVTSATTNYASSCVFISQRILKITVNTVTNRYFTLKLRNVKTPAAVPSGKFNQYRFKLMASAAESSVDYYSYTDYSQHLSLMANPSLIALSWNYYSMATSDSLFTLTALTNQVITVQIGFYSNVVELRQSIYPANFKSTMTLALVNYPTQFLNLGGSITVPLGKPTAYFRLAAQTTTSPGLYTLQFSKSGDINNVYTNVPPLTLVVQSSTCTLTTDALTYTLPVGGSTLPIIINAIKCIPTNYINFTMTYGGTGASEFSLNNDLSTVQLKSNSVDGQLYFIFQHSAAGALVAGSSVTVTFGITGPNLIYYVAPTMITLTLVDATTFQSYPTATALAAPTLSANTANFQLQCSQASLIYWGIGVYPSILNKAAVDFEARIISNGMGLATNFSQTNDFYGKVYGVRQGSMMQVIAKKLYNLQSNTNYIFKYFCINQLGHTSDSQSINFTTLNYGAYLMKVEITFRGSINYGQYNDIACSLAQNFIIPYTRVMTEAMSICASTTYTFYANNAAAILNQPDSNGWYIYGFYIEPDYTIASDTTNANIRNQLSLSTSATTIVTSTNNYISLPSLVQMQTYDIQIYTAPILSISSPLSGLTSVVLTASITNMNGFIIMGVMAGSFDPLTMTVPSTTNIKQGIFSTNVSLVAVQMIHSTQNYNSTFQFAGLTANTIYTFFYFATVEDPSITSLSSTVGYINAQTLQMLIIDINWQPHIAALALLALFLLI